MRLEKIKLAGFKSFVDPTTIPLPGNLVGVVGPNGCGKSNVIDAVRWVMGESSAKHLRGDSMTDVIFNGSSTRKPVGLASVELTFDNSDSRVGGEMGRYQQISIRRQVSRDAQSAYFLNGTRCRRKDITDLFLGTGLGSRSYAIIEQGTISRLVEAKPMELREIIEEAAGISRYKERRHETELRIGHTRENLERLTDLRDEVAKQVQSLQRQAKKAEKYTALKAEEQRYRQQLLGLRWRKYDQQFQAGCAILEECEQQFRARREQGATLEAELTAARQNLDDLQDQLNERQARFYELSAEVSRLDQAIKHAKATRASLEQEQARLTEEQRQAQAALSNDEAQLDQQRRERADIEAQLAEANAAEGAAEERRALADAALRAARSEVDGMAAELHRLGARIDVQRTRLKQLEQQERQWEMRQERLETERDDLRETLASEAVESLREEEAELDAARADLQRQLAELNADAQAARQQIRECQEELNRIRAEQHTAEGKISSLERLQEHAMGKDRAGLNKWLSARGLQQTSRLAEHLDVAPGWEAAVESVLGGRLQALCVTDAGPFLADLGDIGGESLSFFETRPTPPPQPAHADQLLSRVSAPWQLGPLLGSVWCAEDRDSARQRSDSLAEHESVVTPDGLRFGSGWLAAERPDDGTSGVLARERELRDLKSRRDQLHERQAGLAEQLASAEQTLRRAEQERERLQGEERQLAAEYSRVKSELSAAMARCEQATRRLRQVEAELDDVAEQRGNDREAADEARAILLEAEDLRADLEPRHAATLAERQRLDQELGDAESAVRDARDRCLGLRGKAESLAAADSLTSKHLDRARQQFQTAEERLAALAAQLAQAETPDDDRAAVLEELIEQRAEAEQSLAALRKSAEAGEAELRRLSEARLGAERGFDQVKQRLEETKLDLQGNEVRRQTVQEQFEELGADPAAAVASLPDDADEKEWQNRLNGLVDEITKLGAVNLTALEECQAQEERLAFLEQQHLDLTESLDSLADAIDKIDKECRGRFKDTFDRINAGLQRMFPKLFGGGQASLDLTDRDLLESGVTITARPPGKRNSSIHLLSGGEKALTAVALVFAIFELNPAPFCLLDEVDAPLDDANVGRFSQLVKEMSEKVQFLFISHNKVTMEIAQHLAGVTMKEPGVSRIVAVDIDAAVELATA